MCSENYLLTVDIKCLRKLSQDYIFLTGQCCCFMGTCREMHVVHLGQKRRSTGFWDHSRYVALDTEGRERTDLLLEDGSAKLSILYLLSIECSRAVMIS